MNTDSAGHNGEAGISRTQKIILLLVAVLMFPLFSVSKGFFATFAQTTDKREKVIKKIPFKNEPIEFLGIETDGTTISSDAKFVREGEWLKDFTIRFRNISGKPIVYLSVVLGFPETGGKEPPIGYSVKYGVNPMVNNPSVKNDTGANRSSIAPNEVAEIKISPEGFETLKTFIATRSQLRELTTIDYRIMVVYFEDGSAWSSGHYLRPDPDRPGKFLHDPDGRQEEKQ